MDDEPYVQEEFSTESTVEGSSPSHNQFTGAFFPQGRHLTVAGGQFKNITNIHHAAPTVTSDFRRIPLGDLDLRNQIRFDGESGVAYRTDWRRSVRRMFSARVHGSKAPMTIALYQGENAEEEWRQNVSQYLGLRHPNIVQLFGTVSSAGVHATIFHDELILAKEVMEKYRGSHLTAVYLWAYFETEFWGAKQYMDAISGNSPRPWECTIWIRPSTGHLCVDFALPEDDPLELWWPHRVDWPSSLFRLGLEPPEDSKLIDFISLDTYHQVCCYYFQHYHSLSNSMNASLQLGALIYCPPGSDIESSKELAYIPDSNFVDDGWSTSEGKPLSVMESGWTRVNSWDLVDGVLSRQIRHEYWASHEWLAQANCIFNRLGITSDHRDYFVLHQITYQLVLSGTGNNIPGGYLFLCPLADLQSDNPSYFRHPECAAYWSLDPSGVECLGMEEAEQLGFPAFEFTMNVHATSWDESVYAGSCQFYQGRGFDPDSQDIARELGLRLYQVSTDLYGPFAHLEAVEDKREDSEHENVQLIHESPSEAVESNLNSQLVPEASCILNDVEIAEPCRTWRIVMGVQFAFILTTIILWLHNLFDSRNLTNA